MPYPVAGPKASLDHCSVLPRVCGARYAGSLTSACAGVRGNASVCLTQSSHDPALGDLALTFEALGVGTRRDLGAVADRLGDLGWGHPARCAQASGAESPPPL